MAPTRELESNPASEAEFLSIPLAAFRCSRLEGIDLYCRHEAWSAPKLLTSRELGLAAASMDELAARGHQTLLVRRDDYFRASQALVDSLRSIATDRRIPQCERFALMQTAVATQIEGAFRHTDSGRFVAVAQEVGGRIAELLSSETVAPSELFGLMQHDGSTFAHATNVSAYATVLAQELWSDLSPEELEQIAVGALLHDLGKKFIPHRVLVKPTRLAAAERELIEKHPQLGYETLRARDDLNLGQLMMAYQHHERPDGQGYPVRLLGDEIHPWAKMIAVVDVFDAMTGSRPYRQPASADDALLYLADSAGDQFDPEIVLCWISIFHRR